MGEQESKKGKTNNPKGRPVGSTNRATTELKDTIKNFLSGNAATFEQKFNELTSEDYVKNYIALLKYSIPTLQSTKEEIDFNDLSEHQLDYLLDCLKNGKKPTKAELKSIENNQPHD